MPSDTRPPSLAASPRVPLSVPCLSGREWDYVKECLDTGWVSSAGSFVKRFEEAAASLAGVPHAVATVNGTAALHVALKVIGLEPEEAVLVSNLTFVAPVNAIRYLGGAPIFMDAHPDTWQMDAGKLERFLKTQCERRDGHTIHKASRRRIRALLPVHILGLACDMDSLMALAADYGLAVVEDAAEALGVRYKGKQAGTFGDVGIFSFNGNKIITSGGGGMLVTADPKKAGHARYLTTQAKDDPDEYIHREIGFNYRLNNIQAALGLAQLEQLEEFIQKKNRIAHRYAQAFAETPGLSLMPAIPNVRATHWLYTVLLEPGASVERRKQFIRILSEKGVESRPLWHPIHSLAPYRDYPAFEIENSQSLYERAVSLPSSVGLSEEDQAYCIEQTRSALREWTS